MDDDVEGLMDTLENMVETTDDYSKLNKDAIKRLAKMDAEEQYNYVQSMGMVPLDDEGRQLISCPKKNAVCSLFPIYQNGGTETVCSGPVVRKGTYTRVFGESESVYSRGGSVHEECPYNPSNAGSDDDKGEELEDLFD